jgi:GNAT superfamily N-acetyltransferase
MRGISSVKYQIEIPSNTNEIIQLLDERLYEYNAKTIQKEDGRFFSFIIRGEMGEIIAGIAGWIWANASEITLLWVDEKYRRQGFGEKLLKVSEQEVINAGCTVILIRSYAFQAPSFYEKHGYKIEHVINDFPNGYAYYTLIKRF